MAVDVDLDVAVVPARDGDRRIDAFSRVEQRGGFQIHRCAAAISDHFSGQRIDGRGQPECHHQRHRQRSGERERAAPAHAWRQREDRRKCGNRQQDALGLLRADGGHQHQAHQQRADDRAERIGGVDTAHHAARIFTRFRHRRAGQRKTRAPQQSRRQNRPQAARHIQLKGEPGTGRQQRVDGPVWQRIGDHVGGPCDAAGQQHLAPAQRQLRPHAAHQRRTHAAADGEADQKHRQDDGEDVDRGAEQHRYQARPHHFGAQGGGARKRDGDIHGPVPRPQAGLPRRGWRGVAPNRHGHAFRKRVADRRNRQIDRDREPRGDGGVVKPQQIEASQQAAQHGAGGVGRIKRAPPGRRARRGFHPARQRRQRRAHQHGGRQQTRPRNCRAQQKARHAVLRAGDVDAVHQRNAGQRQRGERGDAQLQRRVNAQRMPVRRHARQRQAAGAQAAHVSRQQEPERDGRRSDGKLQQLIPDDFVDQRRTAAGGKQRQQQRQTPRGVRRLRLILHGTSIILQRAAAPRELAAMIRANTS